MAKLSELHVYSLEFLEAQLGSSRFPRFVEQEENKFREQSNLVLQEVLAGDTVRFIFISGPTSSGKTTFTNRLMDSINSRGKVAHLLSLDDYYYETPISYDEMGRPDFESIDTLELDLLHDHLACLARGEELAIPRFDFVHRKRIYEPGRTLQLAEKDILLIEGLHALSERITHGFAEESVIKIFLMPYGQFMHDKRTLSSTDIRKLRRISRDVSKRGSTALSTLDYWPAIAREEENFIGPYLEAADYYINTLIGYEFLVLAPYANEALKKSLGDYMAGVLRPSDNIKEGLFYADLNRAIKDARRLSKVCKMLPQVASSVVPPDSLLQEFI